MDGRSERVKLPSESQRRAAESVADASPAAEARPGDGALLRRFQGGDTAAFTELLRRWDEPGYRIACRVTRCHAAAEDVRQTVFLRLWEKPRSIRSPERFGVWFRRAIVNEAINVARRASRTRARRTTGPDAPSRDGAMLETLGQAEEVQRLEWALEQLVPEERALLTLRFDEDLTFQEISHVVDKPLSTIKSQARRAVTRLGRIMESYASPEQ